MSIGFFRPIWVRKERRDRDTITFWIMMGCLVVLGFCLALLWRSVPKHVFASDAPAFALGMTESEVEGVFGKPSGYRGSYSRRRYPSGGYSAAVAVESRGKIGRLYSRTSASNEYEIRVYYGSDVSKSVLHPVAKVSSVEFIVDRPAPFRALLADLPEAALLCRVRCVVQGETSSSRSIVVYQPQPTAEQKSIADGAAGGFERPEDPSTRPAEDNFDWYPSLRFSWENRVLATDRRAFDSWESVRIESVTLEAADPEFNDREATRFPLLGLSRSVHLTQWP